MTFVSAEQKRQVADELRQWAQDLISALSWTDQAGFVKVPKHLSGLGRIQWANERAQARFDALLDAHESVNQWIEAADMVASVFTLGLGAARGLARGIRAIRKLKLNSIRKALTTAKKGAAKVLEAARAASTKAT